MSAFSKSAKPLIKYAAQVLHDNFVNDMQSDRSKCIIVRMDTYILNALQRLAQGEAGTVGFKTSWERCCTQPMKASRTFSPKMHG